MKKISAKKTTVAVVFVILLIILGYTFVFPENTTEKNNIVDIDQNGFAFESAEVVLRERRNQEDITGNVDGQLAVADANDFVNIDKNKIRTYKWETSDSVYNDPILKHFYEDAGSHRVSLTVTDTNGNEYSDETKLQTRGIQVNIETDVLSDTLNKKKSLLTHEPKTDRTTYTYTFTAPNLGLDENKINYTWDLRSRPMPTKSGKTMSRTFQSSQVSYIVLKIAHEELNSTITKRTAINAGHDYHSDYTGGYLDRNQDME